MRIPPLLPGQDLSKWVNIFRNQYERDLTDRQRAAVTVPTSTPATPTTPPPAPSVTPPPATFTSPSQTTGLELWYDLGDGASVVTSVFGKVSQVNDKTANAHNATQGNVANRPIYQAAAINSLACARFDTTFGQALVTPHATAIDNLFAGGGTLMAVLKVRTAGNGFSKFIDRTKWWIEFNSTSISLIYLWNGSQIVWAFSPTTQWSYGGGAFLFELDYNSSSTTVVPTLRINGVPQTIASTIGSPSGTADSDAAFDMFMGGGNFDGDVGALWLWPAALSDADRANMRAYASNRWAIGVSNTTATSTSTDPANSNTPVAAAGTQPATTLDLSSAAVPGVTAQQGQGWSCVADYTFGTGGGSTVTNYTDLAFYCYTDYGPGAGPGVNRLNDEWELFVNLSTGNHNCHVFATDHLKLRARINDLTLYNAQVARCRASVLPPGQTPDNHDWGSWQGGSGGGGGFDCGVQSGLVRFKRTQKYGYFEWKAQVPPSTKGGAWPANWFVEADGPLKAWPPEVDVLEMAINNAPDNSFNSFHNCAVQDFNPKVTLSGALDQFGSYHGGFDQSTNPVIYAVLWQPGDGRGDRFTIYVNQVVVWDGYYPWKRPDLSDAGPAQFISNLAFGGNWPGRLGACADATVFPVDYPLYYFRMFAK